MIYKLLLVTLYFAVVLVLFRLQSLLRVSWTESTVANCTLENVQHVLPYTFCWLLCRVASQLSGNNKKNGHCNDRTTHRDPSATPSDAQLMHEDGNDSLQQFGGSSGDIASFSDVLKFRSIEHFAENVDDTKACVWVVLVVPPPNNGRAHRGREEGRTPSVDQWGELCSKLDRVGIRMGAYDCSNDPRLCRRTGVTSDSLLLTMPTGLKPKGNVATFLFEGFDLHDNEMADKAEKWITSLLESHVTSVVVEGRVEDTLTQLANNPTSSPERNRRTLGPSATLAYTSTQRSSSLILAVLAVKFTGRVDFLHLKGSTAASHTTSHLNVKMSSSYVWVMSRHTHLANNPVECRHHSNDLEYHYLDIFLRTVHPETNDLFLTAIFLINLACLLDVFLRDGGPLKRLVYSLWVTSCANTVLIFVWLPLLKLFFLPQMLPLMKLLLAIFQSITTSEFASSIRQDLVEVLGHLAAFLSGFVVYCCCIGYIKYRAHLTNPSTVLSWADILAHDLHDIKQIIAPLFHTPSQPDLDFGGMEEGLENLIRYLAVPNLWLMSLDPLDNMKHTTTVVYCSSTSETAGSDLGTCSCNGDSSTGSPPCQNRERDCAICLEAYSCGNVISVLPCHHTFHKNCISGWVCSSSKLRCRTCPTCRWPLNRCQIPSKIALPSS